VDGTGPGSSQMVGFGVCGSALRVLLPGSWFVYTKRRG
jgi:hypothetical protein